MGTEIERKFLVPVLPDLGGARPVAIRQGYLTRPEDSVELRLREMGEAHFLTVKTGAGLERVEREAAIDAGQFATFWPLTEGRRVEKTRWTGRLAGGETWELDIFEGALAGLVLVEVEFPDRAAAEAFVPPGWFGRDVTGEQAYGNRTLALRGLP